ncbi:hypothetical protein [Aequorivita capsosiphonis]|uniref:hypothetical protein n=1 Tax=Aequorivita capsosiphonis TaxID=487317 RepID=UPI0004226FC0|nr:hypothetical protein [Aequorivita capsosiphonis]
MKSKHFLIASLLFLLSLNVFASEATIALDIHDKDGEIFTAKDKDFLQQWHYKQVLKMKITEKDRDEYFSRLNQFTYKMSRLGLPEYHYTDAERKHEFERLVDKLDAVMKNTLSPSNYIIHHKSFDRIEDIVYEKRNWEE